METETHAWPGPWENGHRMSEYLALSLATERQLSTSYLPAFVGVEVDGLVR